MFDPNRTVYFDSEPYKIISEVDRNKDEHEKIPGITLIGSVWTLRHCVTGDMIRVYPWDCSDPDGLDAELIRMENQERDQQEWEEYMKMGEEYNATEETPMSCTNTKTGKSD